MTIRQTRLIAYIIGLILSTGSFITFSAVNKSVNTETFRVYMQFLQWSTVAFIGSKGFTSAVDTFFIKDKKNDGSET